MKNKRLSYREYLNTLIKEQRKYEKRLSRLKDNKQLESEHIRHKAFMKELETIYNAYEAAEEREI